MIELNDSDFDFDDTQPGGSVDNFWYVDKLPLTPEQQHAEKLRNLLADLSLDADFVRREDEKIAELKELPVTVENTVAINDATERRRAALTRIANRNIEISEL